MKLLVKKKSMRLLLASLKLCATETTEKLKNDGQSSADGAYIGNRGVEELLLRVQEPGRNPDAQNA